MGLRLEVLDAGDLEARLYGMPEGALGLPLMAEVSGPDGVETVPWPEAARRWSARHRATVSTRGPAAVTRAALLEIGREMGAWLGAAMRDGSREGLAAWPLEDGLRGLEVAAELAPDAAGRALLDAPWELLAAGRGGHLAGEAAPLSVWRSLGRRADATPLAARHRNLALMFMAASPRVPGHEAQELDYEAEEAAILTATGATERLALHVEETGCLDFLVDRLDAEETPFEALHVSCHGDVLDPARAAGLKRMFRLPEEAQVPAGPVLLLESATGGLEAVSPGGADGLSARLEGRAPALLALSACRTAMSGAADDGADAGGGGSDGSATASSLAERMVEGGVANVLAWGESVWDDSATEFARVFYGRLADGGAVPSAAARARRELFLYEEVREARTPHWHLARIYAGPAGGGALVARGLPVRQWPALGAHVNFGRGAETLPVAPRRRFVGRRREAQAALAAFRAGRGALLRGTGASGKSSLAARLAQRRSDLTPVAVRRDHRPDHLFQELARLAPTGRRAELRALWTARIGGADGWRDPARRADLGDLFEEALLAAEDGRPALLVLDDLEGGGGTDADGRARGGAGALAPPAPGETAARVKPALATGLAALLEAFERLGAEGRIASRLIVTSRYAFTLPEGGRDLAETLEDLPLGPLSASAQARHWATAVREAGGLQGLPLAAGQGDDPETAAAKADARHAAVAERLALSRAARTAAGGHAGLQEVLQEPVIAGELGPVRDALAAIERAKAGGGPPAGGPETFARLMERIALETYAASLTGEETRLFAAAAGLGAPDWPGDVRLAPADASAEAGPDDDRPRPKPAEDVASQDAGPLDAGPGARRDAGAGAPGGDLAGGAGPADGAGAPALAARRWAASASLAFPRAVFRALAEAEGLPEAAAAAALARLDRLGLLSRAGPERWRVDPAARLAAPPRALEDLLRHAAAALPPLLDVWRDDDGDLPADPRGLELHRLARLHDQADPAALAATGKAAGTWLFNREADARSALALLAPLRDLLAARGVPPDPNLMLLTANAAERLGAVELQRACLRDGAASEVGDDVQRAVLESNLAPAELNLHGPARTLERLQAVDAVFLAAGDPARRDRAINQGRIADILYQQGDLAEARRIREEEQLPVYEALGDRRSEAVTRGKIADILQMQGDLAEARRIREEACIPAFEALGDRRSVAVTRGQIADILEMQGDLAEARRIHEEESIPAFEALGDRREVAVTRGKVTDILFMLGDLAEARRILEEACIPAFEALGDRRSVAVTRGKIAQILEAEDDLDGALEAHLSRVETVTEMNNRDGLAHVRYSCAQIRLRRGDHHRDPAALQLILDELAEAFSINLEMGRADGVGAVGALLAQVLAMGGLRVQALQVLNAAEAAYAKLGNAEGLAHVQQLRATIGSAFPGDDALDK